MTAPSGHPRQTPAPACQVKARVLIVDDHSVVCEGLTQLINGEPDMEVCGEASNAEQALDAVLREKPDLAIVDIALGGVNGIELIKNVKATHSSTRILVVSMHDEMHYAERAMRAGASGYIMKREARQRLMQALRTVLSGEDYVSEKLQKSLVHQYLHGSPATKDHSPISRLSDRELEVLDLLGRGLSTKQIAEQLHLSQKTVDSHRTHLKEKLGFAHGTDLVSFAFEWIHAQQSA